MGPKQFIPATDPRVLVSGRCAATTDGALRFDWPATALRLAVRNLSSSGSVWLRMSASKSFFAVSSGSGDSRRTLAAMKRGVVDYELPITNAASSSASDGVSVIDIVKRTEARPAFGLLFAKSGGIVTLHGVVLESGDGELVAPPPFPSRVIEVIGDSDSCGFGCEGPRTGTDLRSLLRGATRPADQDASRAWPALVGVALDAQAHCIAWSGMGACWNAPFTDPKEPMSVFWDRLVADDAAAGTASSTAAAPDAVVVYLGGNDYWTMGPTPPFGRAQPGRTEGHFVDGLAVFLRVLRAARSAPIPIVVLAADEQSGSFLPTRSEQAAFSRTMQRLLAAAIERAALDEHVHLIPLGGEPAISVDDDADWGLMAHWSVQGHAKVARGVAARIGERLRWSVR